MMLFWLGKSDGLFTNMHDVIHNDDHNKPLVKSL